MQVTVCVNDRLYLMPRSSAEELARAASDLVPVGIYAVESGGYMALRNDHLSGAALEAEVEEWERCGFTVHCNR